ncbi:MAG: hypothetical protein R3F56_08290 [Planctomycetota bacterium]
MTRRRGLALFAVGFCALFFWLRATSTFARVEARRADAVAVAKASGLDVAEVLALLDLGEGRTPTPELERVARRVVAARRSHGDLGLAVAAVFGHDALVQQILVEESERPAAERFRALPEGLVATRFLTMVGRYREALGSDE